MSLVAGAFFVSLYGGMDLPAHAAPSACEDAAELAFLPSPIAPWKGAPLRVLFAAEKPLEGEMWLIAPDGSIAAKSRERHGGPPYFWFAEVESPAAGTWHATLVRHRAPAECSTVTREITVPVRRRRGRHASRGQHWPLRNAWNRATENLFSAWIEKLFDAPLERSRRGRRCTRCCATGPAISCSIIWVLAKTRWGCVLRPDCADFRISCAPISRSRWGCRSAIRNARAAAAARRRSARNGSTF